MNWGTPLTDIPNGRIAAEKVQADRDDDRLIDRLLLVRSELSAFVNQIDEIVAKELDDNRKSKIANEDIESLINLLSGLNLSLKPWVSRLNQAHITSTKSPQKIHASTYKDRHCSSDMIISPSPLVAWRAGVHGLATGRPIIFLTPLSKPHERLLSLCPESSKLGVRNFGMKETNDEALQLSPSVIVSRTRDNFPEIVKNNMTETRTKMSFFNFSATYSRRGDSGEALEWFLSPPKTCALMDTDHGSKIADYKSSSSSNPTVSIPVSMDSLSPQKLHDFASKRYCDEALEWFLSPPKTCSLMEPLEEKIPSTPVPSKVVLESQCPGENTLKKELWTKFQALSMGRLPYVDSLLQEVPKKGFLDMLEEVSF